MKSGLNIFAGLLIIVGAIWTLQGLNLFPGDSFMNGDIKWLIIGVIMIGFGIGLIVYNRRTNAAKSDDE